MKMSSILIELATVFSVIFIIFLAGQIWSVGRPGFIIIIRIFQQDKSFNKNIAGFNACPA